MKTAWFLVYPEVRSWSVFPLYEEFGLRFCERLQERMIHWMKQSLLACKEETSSLFIVLSKEDSRLSGIQKRFRQAPSLSIKVEFSSPDTFPRRCELLREKYRHRFERLILLNLETPLWMPRELEALFHGDVDLVVSPQGRVLAMTEVEEPQKKRCLPAFYDARSLLDILRELSMREGDLSDAIAGDLDVILQDQLRPGIDVVDSSR